MPDHGVVHDDGDLAFLQLGFAWHCFLLLDGWSRFYRRVKWSFRVATRPVVARNYGAVLLGNWPPVIHGGLNRP